MERLERWVTVINGAVGGFVWGPVMLTALLLAGFYFSAATGFLQLRRFRTILRGTVGTLFRGGKRGKAGGISPFQALTTALAGTAGTGNIVGVAAAIATGGPGAVFWMWVSALLGTMTKYAEIVLAIRYRKKRENGEYAGGPMYYLERGMGCRTLAELFALFGVFACFGIGNMTQVNSIAIAARNTFGIPRLVTGLVVAALTGFVILGGIRSIAAATEKLVPLMAAGYTLLCAAVLLFHLPQLPAAFWLIFHDAFTPASAAGGFAGATVRAAIRQGVSKGVFSNEAGMGSASIAHAAAETDHPVQQAMWGIFEVIVDTWVMCSLTALAILSSGVWQSGESGVALTISAFATVWGDAAGVAVTVAIFFFAFATLVSWSYYGETCLEYLLPGRRAAGRFRRVFLCFVVIGAVARLELVWGVADTFNGLMAVPNLIGLLALSPEVLRTTGSYFSALPKGEKSVKSAGKV